MNAQRSHWLITVFVGFSTGLLGSFVGHKLFSSEPSTGGPAAVIAPASPFNQEQAIGGCETESQKFNCKSTPLSEGGITGCLLEFEDQLSPECQDFLATARMRLKVCENEIKKFCPTVKKGRMRIPKCLKAHLDQLSPACAKSIGP